jgi:hypothetical protein
LFDIFLSNDREWLGIDDPCLLDIQPGLWEYVEENKSKSNFLFSIKEMIIEGFGYRSDRIYREPPGGSTSSTGSSSQMPGSK